MIFNPGQEYALQEGVRHIHGDTSEQVLQISGGPGTGKTTIMHEMIRRIEIQRITKCKDYSLMVI